jgi:hypothetical protein
MAPLLLHAIVARYDKNLSSHTSVSGSYGPVPRSQTARKPGGPLRRAAAGVKAFIPSPLPPDPPIAIEGALRTLLSQADLATEPEEIWTDILAMVRQMEDLLEIFG